METSITTVTDGQKKQVKRFAEDAVDRAIAEGFLDKDGIQKLIESGDEFQARIITGIKELSVSNQFAELSVSNQFAAEEVESSYAYPKGYKVKGITEQTNILRQLFPGIGFADEKLAEQPLPQNAEGWFAIPKWQTLAPTYGEAVEKVLAMIGSKRTFYNYREGQITPAQLRVHARTARALDLIAETQKGDILIVAAQLGMRHRGKSVRRAREVFVANEFGLGSLAVGSIVLTHPEREVQWEQLHIDCPGDEYSPDGDGVFSDAPYFLFYNGKVKFYARWVASAVERCGSASGFLSPSSVKTTDGQAVINP